MTVFELISLFSRYRKKFNNIEVTQMAGLTVGTTATKLKTVSPIVFFLYNQEIQYPATDDITITPCAAQAANSFCYYLVSIDINSTVTTTKGVDNTYALPSTPAGNVPIGAFLATTDSTHIFIAGTDPLTGYYETVNFYDIDTGMGLQLINQAQTRLERGVTIVRNNTQRTLMDFDHMMVRASAISLVQGDSKVTLPFPNFKDFVDNGINITDITGLTTQMEKEDTLPTGVVFQFRPGKISRRIVAETVFTPDGYPGMEFDIWPQCDQAYTLDVQAYQYSPALDGVIYQRNWLTDNAPDILLFGALMESGLYFGADSQNKEWEARWQEAIWTLYTSQHKEVYSGSPIYTRYPTMRRGKSLGMASNKAGIMSYGFIDE